MYKLLSSVLRRPMALLENRLPGLAPLCSCVFFIDVIVFDHVQFHNCVSSCTVPDGCVIIQFCCSAAWATRRRCASCSGHKFGGGHREKLRKHQEQYVFLSFFCFPLSVVAAPLFSLVLLLLLPSFLRCDKTIYQNKILRQDRKQDIETMCENKILKQYIKTRHQNNRLSDIFIQPPYWGEVLRSITCFTGSSEGGTVYLPYRWTAVAESCSSRSWWQAAHVTEKIPICDRYPATAGGGLSSLTRTKQKRAQNLG